MMEADAPRPLWRRLVPLAIVAVLAGLVLAGIFVDRSPAPPTGGTPLPTTSDVSLSPGDHRKIDRALDVFLASALERRDVGRSFAWVTPGLRGGKTRSEWTADHVPVLPYQAREANAHDWRLTYAKPGEAGMELLLHPAKSEKLGPIAFTIRVKQVGSRWLVDTWYPNAIFAKEGDRSNITAVPDLGPAAVPDRGQADDKPSSAWISIPLLIVGLPVLIALAAAVTAAIRAIRNRRRPEPLDERALASWEAYRPDRDRDRV